MSRAGNEGLMLDLTRAVSPVLDGRDLDTVVVAMADLTISIIMYAHKCSRPEALTALLQTLGTDAPRG